MSSVELKLELHRIIEQIDDSRILLAVHTLLEGKSDPVFSTDRNSLKKREMDVMLSEGEDDIHAGKVTDQRQLIEEIKTWRKK